MKSENKSKEAGNGPLLKKLYVRVCANYILIKFLSANIDFYVGMSFFQTGGTGREKNCWISSKNTSVNLLYHLTPEIFGAQFLC